MKRVWAAAAVAVMATTISVQGQERRVFPGPIPNLPFSAAVRADGLIYLAGTLSQDGGDIRVQTRAVLEDMDKTLRAAGSRLANVAAVHVYIARAEDFAAMSEVYATFWEKDPPVRTTVVTDLVIPGALVEMSMVAVPDGGERTVIHPANWVPTTSPYSFGIKSGDTLFLAGLISRLGRDNSMVEGDMTVQTKTALDNAGEILKAAGMSYANVVSSRVYITDGTKFQDMNRVYGKYFATDPPARATVIASLMAPQYQVEITLTAVNAPKRVVTTPQADGSPGNRNPVLSSGIEVGNRLYLSGMLGSNADTKGNMEAQTRETLVRIGRTLKAAGYDWSHVVDGIVYITDVGQFEAMNRAYREVFGKEFPARATVRSGLVNADGLVEIMFVAVK